MKMHQLLIVGVAAVALTACSQQEASDADAGADNAITTEMGNGMDPGMGNMTMNAQGPFAESERSMHEQMAAAVGVDAADTWARKMIAHHQGAVDMSREVLALDSTPGVRRMAQMTIDNQSREIEELRGLVREGAPSPASAQLYQAVDEEMMRRMMAATGSNPSETWTRKMIEHHRGALQMSDVVLAQNPPAEIRRRAEQTKADQGREISELERMLQPGSAGATTG